ncbi:SyrB-like regulator [Rhizobium sp. S152]|uniref:SyrB-like regulator n=1 Tax=Rhizobium sp. S152 TaxID=3055038 RepID=UPI0025AA1860|nr:SyrB-like regulator [Rhizobium sp. S152]MDM9624555.1 SyrB-like regulator [Rhizobium sp. S152]
MADELSTPPASEVAGAENIEKAPVAKKTRAPRRAKAAESETVAAPKTRRGGRRKVEAVETAPVPAEPKRRGRGPTKSAVAGKTSKSAPTVTQSDDLAELLQLEEENKRLRKALAEKLRAENADLRRRIGS